MTVYGREGQDLKKVKAPKKKPYKSVISNTLWSWGEMLRHAPAAFISEAILSVITIFTTIIGIYLPSVAVREASGGFTMSHAVISVGGLVLASQLLGIAGTFTGQFKYTVGMKYRNYISGRVDEKTASMYYELTERQRTRVLREQASRSTQMWYGAVPSVDLPNHALSLIKNIVLWFLCGGIVSLVSPWLIPVLTLAPAVNWLAGRIYQRWEYSIREEVETVSRRLGYITLLPGDFGAAKDIRIYGLAGWFRELYRDIKEQSVRYRNKRLAREFLVRAADLILILIRDGAAYALLIIMTARGEMTPDRFVLCFGAISSFAGFIGGIVSAFGGMRGTSLVICDLREYLDLPDRDGSGEARSEDVVSGPEIVFDNVCYRYEGADEDTIHGLTLTIKPCEKIALVGPNGAGKTTLVKLLCGLYQPTSGEIRINGHPVKDYRNSDYYRLFSPVFQDIKASVFTIAETVSGEWESATDLPRAEECIRKAGLKNKIDSLTLGIHTPLDKQVNENGVELSGGELQKLMLARAIYKDAPVLVLDEPTAALDPLAENEVYRNYSEMASGKTAVFISHRLASCRFCDRIIYLDGGMITESGSHGELMRLGGGYAKMFDMQSVWYREGVTEHDSEQKS